MPNTKTTKPKGKPGELDQNVDLPASVNAKRTRIPYDDDIFDTGYMRSAAFPSANRQHHYSNEQKAPKR